MGLDLKVAELGAIPLLLDRIYLACQMPMSDEPAQVLDTCLVIGLNNLSNFNRRFLAGKSMPPSQFGRTAADNFAAARAA
ncbi:hypothetical protein MPLB_1690078 [Mesorhizobium sp. ORS 3324]|nr:hypothetical protein MPLB_1690078 [Mesorhizobium sp. ORS 3324]